MRKKVEVKAEAEKSEPKRLQMEWKETIHSTTHINREDFYRIVASLANLGEPLMRSPLEAIRQRGAEICSLAHKMDVFFTQAKGLPMDKGLTLELKTREWTQVSKENDDISKDDVEVQR